ncbi:MAG: phosphoadenylyl-sulfate reductase [Parvularculaceae bacterium]
MAAVEERLQSLEAVYRGRDPEAILSHAIREAFPGRIAVVSSFGADAAALLHLVASVDPATPVIFLDTNKLFGETVRYRSRLQHHLGLEDVRVVGPRLKDVDARDPLGTLSMRDPDACCALRKSEPLARALKDFDCWISGRKRHQTEFRKDMPVVEHDGAHFKINPLAAWERGDVADYFAAHKLPEHPLVRQGYFSIGCMPCTSKVLDESDARSGRWAGQAKTECGIHMTKKPE